MTSAKHSKSSLNGLPPELIDNITEYLDRIPVCNLRLTCKVLCYHINSSRFRSLIAVQKIDLTPESIERLRTIATHPQLRSAVQSLTVLAVVHDTSELDYMLRTRFRQAWGRQGALSLSKGVELTEEELEEARKTRERLVTHIEEQEAAYQDESQMQLLAAALKGLGRLTVLALQGAVNQGLGDNVEPSSTRNWISVWIRASQVYRTVMQAMAISGIVVDALHIYEKSTRCSVPTWDVNDLMPALFAENFAKVARGISSFPLSVSTRVLTDYPNVLNARAKLLEADRAHLEGGSVTRLGSLSENDPCAVADGNYPGVARLLKQMQKLECLDLHFYKTLTGGSSSYAKVFTWIANDVMLESLQHVKLRGFYCDEAALLQFLHSHGALVTLELREIYLMSGSWTAIFVHLSTMPSIQQVTLQNIWPPGKAILHLAPRHLPRSDVGDVPSKERANSFPCLDGPKVHTRTFSRNEILKERFQFAKGPSQRQMGSPQFYRWAQSRMEEYGSGYP